MATSAATTPVSRSSARRMKMNGSAARGLTLSDVYDMTADVGKHIQTIANEYGTQLLEPLAEIVIRALEHLEWYVEENERTRAVNCKLLLEADEVAAERDSKKQLESELAGLQLVLLERGRQRDALALRISELESDQPQTHIDHNNVTEMYRPLFNDEFGRSRLASVPHKPRSVNLKDNSQKDLFIKQLQRDLARERKKLLDMENSLLDYQRVQQHTEKEVMDLRKDFAVASARIKRLEEEKAALMERSEVVDDLRAMRLSSASRQDEAVGDSMPKFFKKDLMMIIQERNELKEKVMVLSEELATLKLLEGSLVIFDLQNSLSNGESRTGTFKISGSVDFRPTFDEAGQSCLGSTTPNPNDVETAV